MLEKTLARTVLQAMAELSKKDRSRFLIIALSVFFFVVTSVLSFQIVDVPNSPDEMANRAFALQFADTWTVHIDAPAIALQHGLAPRSVTIDSGAYVPAAFYGLPVLYGVLAGLLAQGLLWAFAPFFVALAGLAFFGLMRRVWGERVGMIAGMLYFLHPVLWYYTVRGMYPNALFLSLLIIGLYLALVRPIRLRSPRASAILYACASACAIALALFVRPAEVLWVLPLLILLFCFGRIWRDRLFTATWAVLGIVAILVVWLVGGHEMVAALRGGYVMQDLSISGSLLPFGFHPRAVLWNSWWYLILVPGFVVIAGVFGLLTQMYNSIRTHAWTTATTRYTGLFLLLALYPIVLYGSWAFADNPTPWLRTVGDSHLRYWLPVMIFLLPFAAQGLTLLFDAARRKSIRMAGFVWVGFFLAWFVQSYFVFFAGVDGYRALCVQYAYARSVREQVSMQIPYDALLVVDRWDKVFWPNQTVARDLFSTKTLGVLRQLERSYYFGPLLSDTEEKKLTDAGVQIARRLVFAPDHGFYTLQPAPSSEHN